MMKKVLVTGGTGFIGSNLIKGLLELNCRLTSLDNNSTGNKKNEFDGVEYIEDDITNIDKLDNDLIYVFILPHNQEFSHHSMILKKALELMYLEL